MSINKFSVKAKSERGLRAFGRKIPGNVAVNFYRYAKINARGRTVEVEDDTFEEKCLWFTRRSHRYELDENGEEIASKLLEDVDEDEVNEEAEAKLAEEATKETDNLVEGVNLGGRGEKEMPPMAKENIQKKKKAKKEDKKPKGKKDSKEEKK